MDLKKKKKVAFFTPRIIMIAFILFLSLFALDIFEMQLGFWGTIVGLFMHLIPNFILAMFVWLTWHRPLIASIVCFSLALAYVVWTLAAAGMTFPIIPAPLIVVGCFYLWDWSLNRKKHR